MATHIPTIHNFTALNFGKYKEVTHYELVQCNHETATLDHYVNLSKNREFNRSRNVAFWYKSKDKNSKKWSKPITGLKRTSRRNIYFGDIAYKTGGKFVPTHLLIFVFNRDFSKLQILHFKGFYPKDTIQFVENYISNITVPL